jgi:hypothetical protein
MKVINVKLQCSNFKFEIWNYLENNLAKNLPSLVIPAKAGIQRLRIVLDSRWSLPRT